MGGSGKKTTAVLIAAAVLGAAVLAVTLLPEDPAAGRTDPRPVQTAPGTTGTEQTLPQMQDTIPADTEPADTVPGDTEPAVQSTIPSGTEPEEQKDPVAPAETGPRENVSVSDGMEFPLMMDDGRISIREPFLYDGMNPDYRYDEGKNIAAIVLQNLSGVLLERADITLSLADGTDLTFRAEQIPAGGTVLAFSTENAALSADAEWESARCSAWFGDGDTGVSDKVSVSVSGMDVTVTNRSGGSIGEIVIYCHNVLGEEYFGGKAYPYTIYDLPAGESTTIQALDCILGMAAVTRVDVNQE